MNGVTRLGVGQPPDSTMICLLGQGLDFFEHGGDLLHTLAFVFLMSFVSLEDTILDTRYILITTSLLYGR